MRSDRTSFTRSISLLILFLSFLILLLALAWPAVPPASASTVPTLTAFVSDGHDAMTIGMDPVPAPGEYILTVHDYSAYHDFHLSGPGVDVSTGGPVLGEDGTGTNVSFIGPKTFDITLQAGQTYLYRCDPHWVSMQQGASFTVPAAPPTGTTGPTGPTTGPTGPTGPTTGPTGPTGPTTGPTGPPLKTRISGKPVVSKAATSLAVSYVCGKSKCVITVTITIGKQRYTVKSKALPRSRSAVPITAKIAIPSKIAKQIKAAQAKRRPLKLTALIA
jgi:hypothetical protein